MNEFDFDYKKSEYDKYRRLHVRDFGFVEFETNEVIFTQAQPDPTYRRHFSKYGVSLFMPSDSHVPKMYTSTGKEVPPAQFKSVDYGNPYLVWDHKTDVIMSLGRLIGDKQVPEQLNTASIYWAGAGAIPRTGNVITYYPPNVWTPEEKEFTREMMKMAKFTLSMLDTYGKVHNTDAEQVRIAMKDGKSPQELLMTYSYRLLNNLHEQGTSAIQRAGVKTPSLKTKR